MFRYQRNLKIFVCNIPVPELGQQEFPCGAATTVSYLFLAAHPSLRPRPRPSVGISLTINLCSPTWSSFVKHYVVRLPLGFKPAMVAHCLHTEGRGPYPGVLTSAFAAQLLCDLGLSLSPPLGHSVLVSLFSDTPPTFPPLQTYIRIGSHHPLLTLHMGLTSFAGRKTSA